MTIDKFIAIKDLNGNAVPDVVNICFNNQMIQNYIAEKYQYSHQTIIDFNGDLLQGAMDYLSTMQQENMLNDISVNAATMGVGYMESSLPDMMEPYIEQAMQAIHNCYQMVLNNNYQIAVTYHNT